MKELLQFLCHPDRLDVQMLALEQILGLTGDQKGLALLRSHLGELGEVLCRLLDGKSEVLSQDCGKVWVNLTADSSLAVQCLDTLADRLVPSLWGQIENTESKVADACCMTLSNLTIDSQCCQKVLKALNQAKITLERIVSIFCLEGHNKHGQKLNYLGPFLSNLSQLPSTRSLLMERDAVIITRLLTYTQYKDSHVRRGGVIATLRNCCFDPAHHEWLLNESQVDILPSLLLPLAGPTPDSFDDEDIDKLPVDLQYLDEDKQTEPDPDLRKMLLEALYQLCATKKCREYIRSKNAYVILRELHKVEEDQAVKDACEDVVQLLIKKEEEINLDSYHDVDVPEDVAQQFDSEKINT